MDLSFAVLTWNSERYLQRCLGSIGEALAGSGLEYEVLILDNGSQDASPRMLAQLAAADPRVRPFYEAANLGTTRSRNILFTAARGEYLCVMDSDVELAPGVIETLITHLAQDRAIGIVVPRIHYPSGKWQKSFDHFPTALDKLNRLFRLRQIEQDEGERMRSLTAPIDVDYAISAFWLMRRELLKSVGQLDERIFYAPEDTDFCLRVWNAGYRVVYVPSVTVVHHTQEISRGFKLNRAKFSHLKGLCYYFLKHQYVLRRPRVRTGL